MAAALKRTISVYSVIALVIGANGAVLLFVHQFGNSTADQWVGAILAGLSLLTVVAHAFLTSWKISIPADVFAGLQQTDTIIVAVLGAGGLVTTYVGGISPNLTALVTLILQGAALLASLIGGFLEATSAKVTARANAAKAAAA